MHIGISLFLIATGAILTWAVNAEVQGIDLNVVGVILLIVGLVGLLLSLMFWSSFSPLGRREERTVVRDREEVI